MASTQKNSHVMKSLAFCITALTTLSLTACNFAPTKQSINDLSAVHIIEQRQNIKAKPQTKQNHTRLIKQSYNCEIEFTAYFKTGRATEHWIFKNNELIASYSKLETETEKKDIVFNPTDPITLANFHALKNNFSKKSLKQCHFDL